MNNPRYILVAEEFQIQVLSELAKLKELLNQVLPSSQLNNNSELMDTKDAMKYLKCSRRTLLKYRQMGMPFEQKESGKLYYWRSAIDKYFGKDVA